MTKEKFKSDRRNFFICKKCGDIVDKNNVSYNQVHDNGYMNECKACNYISRNKNRLSKIDIKTNDLIHSIFNKEIQTLDESKKYYKSLEDISDIDLCKMWSALGIKGKKIQISMKCKNCGKDIYVYPCKVISNDDLFCNSDCYWKYKKQTAKTGKDNWQYNRIETECCLCKKKINVIPSKLKSKNKINETHIFCSKECYYKFRSEYYIGEKSSGFNRDWTDEQRDIARKNLISYTKKADRLETGIQKKINELLDYNNIKYKREYIIDYYSMDNYLPDYNLIIEVMGDYWHGNPLLFNNSKYMLNDMQARGIHTDKSKHTYIKNHYGINILYLWETDINENIVLCKQLVDIYINNKGLLDNYHSFNYFIEENGNLKLRDKIIIPYQDIKQKEYEYLIKRKA